MNELCPNHVPRGAVNVLALLADAGFHLRFHLAHGVIDRPAESIHNGLVAAHRVEQGYAFGYAESEVVTYAPLRARPHGELLSRFGVKVVAQPLEGELVNRSFKPQT